ncbi:putative tellurite resistance protein [Rhizobium phage RHph_TM16]|nr:putative tellurite resistance protein [Rhizobium phage RHph_TM16]
MFGMFGKKKSVLGAAASAVFKEVNAGQQENLDFLEAAASGTALMATVDGNADSSERNKAISVITKNKILGSVYTQPQVEAIVNAYIDKASDGTGKQELVDELKDLKNHEKGAQYAKAVYLMAQDVAKADGTIGEREAKALEVLAGILGVNPQDFAFDF